MKTLKLQELESNPRTREQIKSTLEKGGLVCVPCRGSYRIIADLYNKDAVTRLMQSKRRTQRAPSLVFIGQLRKLHLVANDVDPIALKLAKTWWPGPLTIRFQASDEIPSKILKQLGKSKGTLSVRVPSDPLIQSLVEDFDGPLLVSSANRAKKHGAESPAQVQRNFLGRVDIFVDAGDLPSCDPSTVVEVKNGELVITREGELTPDAIRASLND